MDRTTTTRIGFQTQFRSHRCCE